MQVRTVHIVCGCNIVKIILQYWIMFVVSMLARFCCTQVDVCKLTWQPRCSTLSVGCIAVDLFSLDYLNDCSLTDVCNNRC